MEEQDNASRTSPTANVVGVKSWLAYAGTFVLALILIGVFVLTFTFTNEIAAGVVMVVSTILVGYRFLMLRSVQLYYDDVGVWVYSGVLPWKKGVTGVKWRDMEDATFVQGFWSWATRSYTVRIGHRFTKSSEIVLTNISNGKNAVGTLNARQQDMIRAGAID